jgi:hypothetical protein
VPPGAGGAGHALAGTHGFGQYTGLTPPGGAAYGDARIVSLQGGSGAGGGGNDGDNEEGAGGGGSGGTVYLVAATLHIEGAITATGGLGGRDDYHYKEDGPITPDRECCNNGGPGSVGRIRLDYSADAILGGTVRLTPPAGYIDSTCLSVEGAHDNLNGQYTHGTHEYVRTDGSMVIRRGDRRQGDYGWNFCRASDGVVLEPCYHQFSRQGEVSDVRNRPAASKTIYRWGGTGRSKISYGCI